MMLNPDLRGRAIAAGAATLALSLPFFAQQLPAQDPARTPLEAPRASAAAWMPLREDAAWTYDVLHRSEAGEESRSQQVDLVWGEVPLADGEGSCWQLLRRRGATGRADPSYLQIADAGLVVLENGLLGPHRAPPRAAPVHRLLAAPVGGATEWSWQTQITYQTSAVRVGKGEAGVAGARRQRPPQEFMEHKARLLGFDVAVTVPAGNYRCAHVRIETSGPGWGSGAHELWFARGVGIVREVTAGAGGTTTSELTAFRPGREVRRAPREQLLEYVADALGERDGFDLHWPPMGALACSLRGRFAVIRVGDSTEHSCVYVDDRVIPFEVGDREFWLARLQEACGAWPGEDTPQDLAALGNDLPLGAMAQMLARLEAARSGLSVDKSMGTGTTRAAGGDGPELSSIGRLRVKDRDGVVRMLTGTLELKGGAITTATTALGPIDR